METKNQGLQRLIRYYKKQTGVTEINMREVAKFAKSIGWKMPTPKDELDLFAKDLASAAREEVRRDKKTGRPYRANHAYTTKQGRDQLTLWVDIDEAPRNIMQKSLMKRREQMVGDGLQLTLDANHWNSINPEETPIMVPLDFTDDVEWKLNEPDDYKDAA